MIDDAAATIGVLRRPSRSEPRWPSVLAVLVALGLYIALPQEMVGEAAGLRFAIPALDLALLAPLALGAPHRHAAESAMRRRAAIVLTAVLSAANLLALGLLVTRLSEGVVTGGPLLIAAGEIWVTNAIVFALWYWELDGGGPRSGWRIPTADVTSRSRRC